MSFPFRLHDRKICVLGMCTLLQLGPERLGVLQECHKEILPAMLLLFQGLKRAYAGKFDQENVSLQRICLQNGQMAILLLERFFLIQPALIADKSMGDIQSSRDYLVHSRLYYFYFFAGHLSSLTATCDSEIQFSRHKRNSEADSPWDG